MPRYRLIVAYEGTDFHGWQKQEPAGESPLRTVQGVLEETVRNVMREPIILNGASRTDAGVHARGQVAAFTSDKEIDPERIARAITARLPDDVQVQHAEFVSEDFDPISQARSKCYSFDYAHGRPPACWPPLFDRRTTYRIHHDLDPTLMNEAASYLVGEHDFQAFAQKQHGRDNTIRTIFNCQVFKTGPHRIRLEVTGSGFLYNIVRIIAGTLREAGRGHFSPEQVSEALRTGNRRLAGPTLPPEGLCLQWIHYGPGELPDGD